MKPHRKHAPKIKVSPSIKIRKDVLWARRMRWALIQLLGARCVECLTEYDSSDPSYLEFDHTAPRDWQPNRTSRWQRMRNYWRDWELGILCLRCRNCNARKGYPGGQLEMLEKTNRQPF